MKTMSFGLSEALPAGFPLPPPERPGTLKGMKMLVVDITAADAAGRRLGRYKVG